jgi:arginyl-tRNA synthetase
LADIVGEIRVAARVAGGAIARRVSWPDLPRTDENPGFRVRFARARAIRLGRYARDLNGVAPELDLRPEAGPLTDARERTVIAMLAELPSRIRRAVRRGDDKPLRRFLERLADAYHDVVEECPALPRGDEPATGLHRARLGLAAAVAEALTACLPLLGVTTDEEI